MRTSLAFAGLVLLLLRTATAPAAEVAERTGGGAVRVDEVNAAGEQSGPHAEHFPDGRPKLTGAYVAGKRSGKWTQFDESGKVRETTVYKDGVRHGAWILNRADGRPQVRGSFLNGRATGTIAILDERGQTVRQIVYPRAHEAVQRTFAQLYPDTPEELRFTKEPLARAPYAAGEIDPACFDRPLKLTQLYRYLSGVSWQDIRIDPAACVKAQHGAVILAKIGGLTHDPTRPSDMDEAFFKLAFDGCHESNLHRGPQSVTDAVRSFMDDSDSRNIARVGHRQWILNPAMHRIGFGHAEDYTAMHVVDKRGRAFTTELPIVAFPGIGYYPFELIESHYAWSAHLNPRRFNVAGATVQMEQLDENYLPQREIPVQTVTAAAGENGGWSTIIFKPQWQSLESGRYWVSIGGLTNARNDPIPLGYLVDLVPFAAEGVGGG